LLNDKKNTMNIGARKKRITIVDDHPIVLEGLAQLINQQADLVVCAKAGNAKQALEAVEKQRVDLVIVDMLLKNTTGIQLTKSLKSKCPDIRILILSMSDEPYYIKHAFQAGAQGYITKDEVADDIISAIRQVLNGKIYLSARLAEKFPRRTIDSIKAGDLDDSVWE
jgi:DNA-binding NarL/FixJ family response regulator